MSAPKAVVLLSGGLDSSVSAAQTIAACARLEVGKLATRLGGIMNYEAGCTSPYEKPQTSKPTEVQNDTIFSI